MALLATLLADRDRHEHIHWAAAIALGRLQDTNVQSLLPGLTSSLNWVVAATLLSLGRRATPDVQDALEPIFSDMLAAEKGDLLNRYACLGLSRFARLQPSTVEVLCRVLGDPSVPLTAKGYAALAITSSLATSNRDIEERLGLILRQIVTVESLPVAEPEAVYALEYIAELSSLLELNSIASVCHRILSDSFEDWRNEYDKCSARYETGESLVRIGKPEEAEGEFRDALSALPKNAELTSDARSIVAFRSSMVTARLRLHAALLKWERLIDSEELKDVDAELRQIKAIYETYSPENAALAHQARQLADRELTYIRNTRSLVEAVRLLVGLDSRLRSRRGNMDTTAPHIADFTAHVEEVQATSP